MIMKGCLNLLGHQSCEKILRSGHAHLRITPRDIAKIDGLRDLTDSHAQGQSVGSMPLHILIVMLTDKAADSFAHGAGHHGGRGKISIDQPQEKLGWAFANC